MCNDYAVQLSNRSFSHLFNCGKYYTENRTGKRKIHVFYMKLFEI